MHILWSQHGIFKNAHNCSGKWHRIFYRGHKFHYFTNHRMFVHKQENGMTFSTAHKVKLDTRKFWKRMDINTI